MAKPDVEQLLKRAEELERIFVSVTETEVPKSLREARETAWELVPNAIEVGWLVNYPREQRALDSQRVMRLDRALAIMEEFEEALIRRHVKDPSQIMFKKLRQAEASAVFLKDNARLLWVAINEVFEHYESFIDIILDLPNLIARVVDALIAISLPVYGRDVADMTLPEAAARLGTNVSLR